MLFLLIALFFILPVYLMHIFGFGNSFWGETTNIALAFIILLLSKLNYALDVTLFDSHMFAFQSIQTTTRRTDAESLSTNHQKYTAQCTNPMGLIVGGDTALSIRYIITLM